MTCDKSWQGVLRPGESKLGSGQPSFPFPEAWLPYSHERACWLAWLSHVIYRQGSDEQGSEIERLPRAEVLAQAGLRERCFLNEGGTQGAVVESMDGRAAALVFRGTHDLVDWMTNLEAVFEEHPAGGRVHRGFFSALSCVWPQAAAALRDVTAPLAFAGHSLGGALALLAAAGREPDAVYTFGAPRVGDADFGRGAERLAVFRLVNDADMVPTLPPAQAGFCHSGELRYITAAGRMLVNPEKQAVYRERGRAFLNIADLTEQLQTLAPHKLLYDHAPGNYAARLRELVNQCTAG